MQFSEAELKELAASTCPHCAADIPSRRREDSGEWVHDQVATSQGVVKGHTICWANGLRQKYGNETNG